MSNRLLWLSILSRRFVHHQISFSLYCIVALKYYLFQIDEKILITTGFPPDDGINSEIVDVENSNFSCTNIEQFPIKLLGAMGG